MFKRITTILLMVSFSVSAQFDFDFDDEIQIPNICENISDFVTPVDLSAACLSAQMAAQTFPPLLPAANQLCQLLEGATATQGVIQLEINRVYEACQLEMNKLEVEMTQGLSEYANLLNSPEIKRKRLLNAPSFDELEVKGAQTPVAGISVVEWEDMLDETSDPLIKQSRKRLLREVAKSNYIADQFLIQGVAEDLVNMIVSMLTLSGSDLKVKTSQDLQVRMSAELVYQQQAFQQILNQYLALVAVQEEQNLAGQRFKQEFLGANE